MRTRTIRWGTIFAETDLGGWVYAKVRPLWYWQLRRAWLFVRIVWRRWDTARLDWRTAWQIAFEIIGTGLVGPLQVQQRPETGD
jgi:hypothetical protein